MHHSIVLFDFDGTLADTFETGAALINEFASRFGYKTIDFAKKRNLSARELVRLSGVKWWQIPRLVRFFRRESARNANNIHPCRGVPLFGKTRALRRAVRQLQKTHTLILYVGDEIRDIEACHAAGVEIISVSWGFNAHEVLADKNPSVAKSADELEQIIARRIEA